MSPERARGHKPGPESDLWSLGATLYAAAEGRPPYDSDNALGTLTAVISDPVEPPSTGGPLGQAIMGLLVKDPAERMDIPAARALLERAAADQTNSATVAAPAAGVAALDRAGRTEALHPVQLAAPARVQQEYTEYARDDEERRPPGLLVLALMVALLVIGGLVAFALAGRGENNTADPAPGKSPSQSAPKESESAEPTTSAPETPAQSTPEATSGGGGAPAGFTTYTDDSGFSVAVPEGWTAQRDGASVDLQDPSGTRFLRIDQTDSPKDDPAKDWESQEKSVSKRLENYQRVRIDSVEYNGWPAADWEFTFGNRTHVLNRGFVPNENKGYALYMSSTEDEWPESLQIFQTAADSFVPAGG